MENTLIKEIFRNTENYLEKEVQISGWVRTIRDSKNFGFIEVNDGSFFSNIQVVFDNKLDNFEEICKLSISSSIIVTGKLVKTENAKQAFEIHANKVEIFNKADSDYPLQKKSSLCFIICYPQFLPRAWICICSHSYYNIFRC